MDSYTFFVIVDAHSKWIEVFKMSSTTATATIQVLRTTFACYGIPESIVSDNGPQFSSSEFAQFCHTNGIRHVRVPPYHPSSNGLTECAVQTFQENFSRHSTRKTLSFSLFLPYYTSINNWHVTSRTLHG